jgi:hypothetical protein
VKRLLLPLVALGVVLVGATSCSTVGSNVAATVGGKDISVDSVKALSAKLAPLEQKSVPKGALLDNTLARSALTEQVKLTVANQELSRRKASVTSADKQAASQLTQSYSSLPKTVQDELAASEALARVIATDSKSPEIAKLTRQVYDHVKPAQRAQICATAIVGPAAGGDAVQKLLDAGTSLTDPSAFTDAQFQVIGTNGRYCTNPAQLPTELQKPWATAPKGVLQRVAFTSQGSDGSEQSGVMFFKVTGTNTLRPNDPAILQSVQQQIQQQPELVLPGVYAKADIHIDPRFGSGFNPSGGVVTAPDTPVVPTTKPKAPKALKAPQTPVSAPDDAGAPSTSTPSG